MCESTTRPERRFPERVSEAEESVGGGKKRMWCRFPTIMNVILGVNVTFVVLRNSVRQIEVHGS